MAKINVSFNGTNYPVDESALSEARSSLKSHLSSNMNGSGATINLDGISYNVDSTKLSTATNAFISHLGTIAGDGAKVSVGGVEYSIDSTKVAGAMSEMEDVLGELASGGSGDDNYSVGLAYTLNADEASYAVSGIGECTDINIIIPHQYEGLPVTIIGNNAFDTCTNLTSITIPDSVTSIGNYAFNGCIGITHMTVPNNMMSIGERAFDGCDNLKSIIIPDSVTSIGKYAFYDCYSLTIFCEATSQPSGWNTRYNGSNRPVVWGCLDNGITDDGLMWVSTSDSTIICGYVGTDTEIVIPEKINNIDVVSTSGRIFHSNTAITSVTIPGSVTSIGTYEFFNCSSLETIIFNGTRAQWNAIKKGSGWNYNAPATYVQCSDGQVAL